jgi:hypothetical protein
MRVDDPFSGSFTRTTETGREVRFVGKSECGMGGPTWGTLEISDLVSLPRALPCFVVDEKFGVAVFQELEMTGTPRVAIHIRRLPNGPSAQHSLEFGAYVFTDVTSRSVGVLDQWTKRKHEFEVPKAHEGQPEH